MPTRYTKHQLFIGRSIWACLCAYIVGSIIDWQIIGQISPEWAVTTLLAIVLGALGFLAANEQVERAIMWMAQTWRAGVALFVVSALALVALLLPYPYFHQVITLGADLPLSGVDTANGQAVQRGAQLAIDKENASNDSQFPYQFRLKALDDVPNASTSANAGLGKKNVESLMQDQHIAGIIGPYNTDVAIKEIPAVDAKGNRMALVSPSTTAECLTGPKAPAQTRTQYDCDNGYVNGGDSAGAFFRLAAPSSKMARVYVGCLAANTPVAYGSCPNLPHKDGQRYKQPIIIDDGTVFSVGMADSIAGEWKSQSSTPLAYGPVSVSQDRIESDVNTALADIQGKNISPDLIVFIGSYQNSQIFQNQLAKYSNLEAAKKAVLEKVTVPTPSLLQQLLGQTSNVAKDFRQTIIDKIRDGTNYESAASAIGTFAFAPDSNGDLRDVKASAVSVFQWNPQNLNEATNINGWDFQ